MKKWGHRKKYEVESKDLYDHNRKWKLTKFIKREMFLTLLSILGVALVGVGAAFAVFSSVSRSSDANVIKSGTLEIVFAAEGTGEALYLQGAFPMSDAEGLAQEGYRFQVNNTGSLSADYRIRIEDDEQVIQEDGCSSKLLNHAFIKMSIDGQDPVLLSKVDENSFVVSQGNLAPSASQDHSIKMWLDEASGNDVLGKHYHGKIIVEAVNENVTT